MMLERQPFGVGGVCRNAKWDKHAVRLFVGRRMVHHLTQSVRIAKTAKIAAAVLNPEKFVIQGVPAGEERGLQ